MAKFRFGEPDTEFVFRKLRTDETRSYAAHSQDEAWEALRDSVDNWHAWGLLGRRSTIEKLNTVRVKEVSVNYAQRRNV